MLLNVHESYLSRNWRYEDSEVINTVVEKKWQFLQWT